MSKRNELVKPGMSPGDAKMIGAKLVKASKENLRKAGELLVRSATEKVESVFANVVLTKIQETIQHINNLRVQLARLKRETKFYENRVSAIESGEYSVDYGGNIKYNEARLNDQSTIWL